MMYTASCPKCGCTEIYRINGYMGAYGSGNNIAVGPFSNIMVHRYVCAGCGFTEEWIDPVDISKIRKSTKALRVGPPRYR